MPQTLRIATAILMLVTCCNAQAPTFPKLWTSDEQLSSTNGQKGFRQVYFDEVNQREASFSNTSQYGLVISDYKANNGDGKVYYINIYGGKRHCMLWCEPDTPVICDAADSLCQPPMKSAKKDGTAVINGIDTTVYKWGDNLGPIPMNELYLYVNEETKGPVRMIRDVHPFGKEVGNITIDFQNFKQVQSIPASVWDLGSYKGNCDSPEPSSDCGSSQFLKMVKNTLH